MTTYKKISELCKGAWSGATAYTIGDIVIYDGSSYICIENHTNQVPPNVTYWALLAYKGTGDVSGPASATDSRIAVFDSTTGKLIKDGGKTIAQVESSSIPASYLDTDGALTGNSDVKVPSQKAVKNYVDLRVQADGWIPADETWEYASPTTITIPTGGASRYAKGDKIKLTQTTVKYFYIVGVADTLLTITGGTSYTLTNATISANYYSHANSPVGFPQWFSYTPTWTNLTVGNAVQASKFQIVGNTVIGRINLTFGTTTSVSGFFNFSLPVTASFAVYYSIFGVGQVFDQNPGSIYLAMARADSTTASSVTIMNSSGTYTFPTDNNATTPFTWTTSDQIILNLEYEMA